MEAFLVSTGVVALAELGDKSQLLVLGLAARFRKPVPIILGIVVATLLNHALAGVVGASLGARIRPQSLRWLLGLSFVGVAAWLRAFVPVMFRLFGVSVLLRVRTTQ
jgi:Ca2+/H+ antiporter, TMEM165/GDT1 family